MKKRVSWEVIEGCLYTYHDRRRDALAQVREALKQGHPIELNRWQLIGEKATFSPVDPAPLLKALEDEEQRIEQAKNAPLVPLSSEAWNDVMRALSWAGREVPPFARWQKENWREGK